jgi:hypothetical protein
MMPGAHSAAVAPVRAAVGVDSLGAAHLLDAQGRAQCGADFRFTREVWPAPPDLCPECVARVGRHPLVYIYVWGDSCWCSLRPDWAEHWPAVTAAGGSS